MGEGPGRESGYGGGGGRGGGDILPAKAVPDGEAMKIRGGATYSGDTARREGGRRADEPIKKWYLAGGRGEARVGRAPARGAKTEGWTRVVYEGYRLPALQQ